MKKIPLFVLFCCFFGQILTVQAQSEKLNVFKVNLTAIAFRNYQVQYERMLSPRISIALSARTMTEGKIPMLGFAEKYIDDALTMTELENIQIKGNSIQPELRFYFGDKQGPQGFYAAPYMTISKYPFSRKQYEFQVEESDGAGGTTSQTKTIDFNGHIQGISGGVLLGSQWKLGKSLSLDWWIIGASYGSSKGKITAFTNETLDMESQNALNESLEELKLPRFELKHDVNEHGVQTKITGPWANLRSGLSLGIRF